MSNSKLLKQFFFLLVLCIELCSCLTAGTHGSIKAYKYPVSKKVLQSAVEKIISESSDIHRDTTRNYIINATNGKNDTIIDNHYNDGEDYLTIKIENDVSVFIYVVVNKLSN